MPACYGGPIRCWNRPLQPCGQYISRGLKREFVEEGIGIYDDTADIESTIALSDVYIGDCVTSVTSLFGVAGKPLFILNNHINTLPEKEDWRGERLYGAFGNKYEITANNQLWISENRDYHYKFYMDLGTGYSQGWYYRGCVEVGDTLYVLPGNARHLLIIRNKKIRRIDFKVEISREGAFISYFSNDKYIFILPLHYPFVLRFNIKTEEICYIEGIREFYVKEAEGEYRVGGVCLYDNDLIFASPIDNWFLFLNVDTLEIRKYSNHSKSNLGTQGFVTDVDGLWLLPLNGMVLTKWNPKTGYIREYSDLPKGFKSVRRPYQVACNERPFGNMIFVNSKRKEKILLSPGWGNMFVSLDRESGRMEKWDLPFAYTDYGKNGYFMTNGIGGFTAVPPEAGTGLYRVWYAPERRLYEVNINTNAYKEIEIEFDYDDLVRHEPGFMEGSEWLQYSLDENVFNSLKDLLDGNITGNQFDRERQLCVFSKVNANTEGTCGEDIHASVKSRLVH